MLGGIDLSWLVGLLSTAILYYVLAKRAQIKVSKNLELEQIKFSGEISKLIDQYFDISLKFCLFLNRLNLCRNR